MKTRLFGLLLVIGVVFGLLRNRQSGEPAAPVAPPASPMTLPDGFFGMTYVLQPSSGFELLENSTMELSFSEEPDEILNPEDEEDVVTVWFNADCNNFHGSFRITPTALESIGPSMMTEMGCPGRLNEQDAWLATFLMSGPELSASGDRLTLTGDTATLSFLNKKVVDPDRLLVGQAWTAHRYIDRGSVSWMSLEAYPTLSFSGDGVLRIFDGCNQLEGRFASERSELRVSDVLPVTEHLCSEEHALKISGHYATVFADGTLTYSMDANVLTIRRGEEGVVASTD